MDYLIEQTYTVSSIDLTDNQKIVLAKAFQLGATDGQSKHIDLTDEKLNAARDILNDMNVIDYEYATDSITINPMGIQLLQNNGILDEQDQLTDIGKTYASGKIPPPDQDQQPTGADQGQEQPGGDMSQNPFESSEMSFKQYLRLYS